MRHDELAERAAECLEAAAAAIEDEEGRAGRATVSMRANEMRVTAFMKNMAEMLNREETEAWEGDHENVTVRCAHGVLRSYTGRGLLVRVLTQENT